MIKDLLQPIQVWTISCCVASAGRRLKGRQHCAVEQFSTFLKRERIRAAVRGAYALGGVTGSITSDSAFSAAALLPSISRFKAAGPFRLDLDANRPGDVTQVTLPHREIFAALKEKTNLLIDDGRLQLQADRCGHDFAETPVIVDDPFWERKGVNVPAVVLPLSAMTVRTSAILSLN